MKIFRLLAALLVLGWGSAPVAAQAQIAYAQTVATCGTPNNTPVVGNTYPVTMDTTGRGCVAASSGTGTSAQQVQGVAASGATNTGNPVKLGCAVNTTLPTGSNGNVIDLQCDSFGQPEVFMVGGTNNAHFVSQGGVSPFTAAANGGSSGYLVTSNFLWSGSSSVTNQAVDLVGGNSSGVGVAAVHVSPSSIATGATLDTHCTAACSTTPTVPSGAHNLYNIVASSTAAGWLLVFDATVCPADGTVTPLRAYAMPTLGTSVAISFGDEPLHVTTGLAPCFSTTGPYTKTASTTAFIGMGYE